MRLTVITIITVLNLLYRFQVLFFSIITLGNKRNKTYNKYKYSYNHPKLSRCAITVIRDFLLSILVFLSIILCDKISNSHKHAYPDKPKCHVQSFFLHNVFYFISNHPILKISRRSSIHTFHVIILFIHPFLSTHEHNR